MVGLRARFCAPLTGFNSQAVIIMLLTVPRRRAVFLRCMSMLFHTVLVTLLLVSLVIFSSSPFTPSFCFFDYPAPFPLVSLILWVYYSIIYLFSLSSWRVIYQLVINLSVLCLVPCPVFVWGPPGLLAAGSCCWVVWGLRSLSAAFPC
jgi:hypothetical protein